jgi:hypothetical protein
MAFDAEAPVREAQFVLKPLPAEPVTPDLGVAMVFAPDPDLEWAQHNPDRLLAFLYVSPRPCAALDALLDL